MGWNSIGGLFQCCGWDDYDDADAADVADDSVSKSTHICNRLLGILLNKNSPKQTQYEGYRGGSYKTWEKATHRIDTIAVTEESSNNPRIPYKRNPASGA